MNSSDLRFDEIKAQYLVAEGRNDVDGMQAALEGFMSLDTFEGRMYAHLVRGSLHILLGDLNAARIEFMKRMEVYEKMGPSKDLLNTWTGLGRIAMYQDDMISALEAFQHVLEIAETLGELPAQAGANSNVGIVLQRLGDYVGALPYLQRGLQLSRETGHRQFEANISNNIGLLYLSMNQLDDAFTFFDTASEQLHALGSLHDALGVQCNIALVQLRQGRLTSAEQILLAAIGRSEELGAFRERADLVVILCDVYMEDGRSHEVIDLLERYNADIKHNPRAAHKAMRTRAHLLQIEGRYEEAKEIYTSLLKHAEETSDRAQQLDHHKDLCELAREMKDFDAYIYHNEAHQKLHSIVSGAEAARLYAAQEKQHEMSILRQERDRERAVLYSTLPQHIAERIIRGEDVSGDHHERAAILFLDIVGFTTHSSSLEPQQTTAMLAEIYDRFDQVCATFNVTKVKTIGDSYMAVAFTDRRGEEGDLCEYRLANTALEMLRCDFYWPNSEPEKVRFRIGLHSGPVVAGVIGKVRLQYDVWGDTVNVASRMESSGEPGKIQVSDAFAAALTSPPSPLSDNSTSPPSPLSSLRGGTEGTWHLAQRGEVDIKGKGLMTTYWLENRPQ